MTIRPILRYPHPGLKTVCTPVTAFDDDLKTLAGDLLETMREAPGVGITAAHIGVFKRLFVLELSKADGVRNYVNPEIISSSPMLVRQTEGSVSMPGATEDVERPASIRLRYQTLSGEMKEEDADGFLAICIQHEIDQLDGIFWLQRLSKLKRDRLIRKWDKAGR
ncbi:peptide deformylase [Rhizobium sp. BG4]|jgi:peptide deformylase|uniref:peptide deformylase n=1 Tax=Rhizobium sp. BG4 TaxID=2613770 RepID=UPI00193E3B2F|nr:peptide deformylase [Rhizobium sp. BG4]QRM45433.1 peptide deformylase [Rhizobium sp. BG4]